MENIELFQAALGLREPWVVERVEFDLEGGRLDLFLGFPWGQRFLCPDTKEKTWRHLDFFQHQDCRHALVPRVKCSVHGTLQGEVPWARPDSGFTLLLEALPMEFAPQHAGGGDLASAAGARHPDLAGAGALCGGRQGGAGPVLR